MLEVLEIVISLLLLSLVFLGLTFGYVEIDDLTPHKDSVKINRKWHFFKGMFQITMFLAVGVALFGMCWNALIFLIGSLAATVVIFNLIINIVRKRDSIFYISKSGFEGIFYKYPKIYYLINVLIMVIVYLLLKGKINLLDLWN